MLVTSRLSIRPLQLEDASFVLALLNSKGWLEYIGDRKVRSIEDAEGYLEKGPLKSYDQNGFGLLLVSLKEGDVPIGLCGLLKREYLDHPDLGFAFLDGLHGKGYGFESASAILDDMESKLPVNELFAFTVPHNIPSIALLKKLGFHFNRPFQIPGEEEELMLFARTRS